MFQETSLSVVIPAYNEENGIAKIVERVLAMRSSLYEQGVTGFELIVVDDGSVDRTAQIVEQYAEVRLVRHGFNRGYGAALKTGLAAARSEMVAFLDADGTYPPEYFPRLCAMVMGGVDLAIGSRMSGAESEMPLSRRMGNWFFANLISFYSNVRVRDCASGMRVFRRDALMRLYPLPDGLNFTPIMSLRAIHEGLKVEETPIPYHERVGRSKLSVVRDGLRYLQSITWTALGYNPVRVLGTLGVIGVGFALLVGLGLLVARLSGVEQLSGWGVVAVFLALISGVAGVSLFNLGATFNYLISLFRKEFVRQGLFGKPIFNPPLDRHFGWMGWVSIGLGTVVVVVVALAMGVGGWPIERLWLWLVGGAMMILIGLQLLISWIVMRKLEELSQREIAVQRDLEAVGEGAVCDGKPSIA